MPVNNIEAAVQRFFDGAKEISDSHMSERFPSLPKNTFELQKLRKYYRITSNGSAHAFVCIDTGDVLMPASWSKPAKHARGNVFDQHNGLERMGPYGPAYLR